MKIEELKAVVLKAAVVANTVQKIRQNCDGSDKFVILCKAEEMLYGYGIQERIDKDLSDNLHSICTLENKELLQQSQNERQAALIDIFGSRCVFQCTDSPANNCVISSNYVNKEDKLDLEQPVKSQKKRGRPRKYPPKEPTPPKTDQI